MSRRHPALLSLVAALAERRGDLALASFTEREIDWAVTTGLGPILHYVTRDDPAHERSPSWKTVLGADLTARVINAGQHDAMLEILEHCRDVAPITLLKGISLADRLYPEPHLRTLRDLDFLIPREDYPGVERTLLGLGYRQPGSNRRRFYEEEHHHGPPFQHPETGNWVEVHWSLVPAAWRYATEPAYQGETIRAETVGLDYLGRKTRRLSDELQLLYLASHWRTWGTEQRILGGMTALFDATLLLTRSADLDWTKIGRWLEGPNSAIDLTFLLSYLRDRGLPAPLPKALEALLGRDARDGLPHVGLLHRLIDRHVVAGRELGWPVTEGAWSRLWRELLRPGPPWLGYLGLARSLLPRWPRESD